MQTKLLETIHGFNDYKLHHCWLMQIFSLQNEKNILDDKILSLEEF